MKTPVMGNTFLILLNNQMNIISTILEGVIIINPVVYKDERGFFKEIFNHKKYADHNINNSFVQDNYSCSEKNVLRGLHFQKKNPQGKLVMCTRGSVFDVVVDINPNSQTFCKYIGVELSEENHTQIWIPPGYAHGFITLTERADFLYKCSALYDPNDESGIAWDDPDIRIEWPSSNIILSEKDRNNPLIKEIF